MFKVLKKLANTWVVRFQSSYSPVVLYHGYALQEVFKAIFSAKSLYTFTFKIGL